MTKAKKITYYEVDLKHPRLEPKKKLCTRTEWSYYRNVGNCFESKKAANVARAFAIMISKKMEKVLR